MEFLNAMSAQVFKLFADTMPRIAAALALLILGWLAALLLAGFFRRLLHRLELNRRIAGWIGSSETFPAEEWLSRLLFYPLLLLVAVGFFQLLNLTLVTEPLNKLLGEVLAFAPRLAAAAVVGLLGWIVATLFRLLVVKLLSAGKVEEQLSESTGVPPETRGYISTAGGNAAYWLILLFFFPVILEILGLSGLLSPVQGMLGVVLGYLPNLFAAVVIIFVGWLVARFVQRVLSNLLPAVGADRLSERIGLAGILGKQSFSHLIATVVYVLMLLPVVVAGLNALKLEAITSPATAMLGVILAALPKLFGAALLLVVAYVAGRVTADLVSRLLGAAGFNTLPERLGIGNAPTSGDRSPSAMAGTLLLVLVMLFASLESLNMLGYTAAAGLLSDFLLVAGRVALGLVVFFVGLYLANLAGAAVREAGAPRAGLLAAVARTAIIGLAGAMALRQMGLANEIITIAFGLILGAGAVAFAIAFGIGGRDVAAAKVKEWVASLESTESK